MGGAAGRMILPGGPGDGWGGPASLRSRGLTALTVTRASPLIRPGSFGGGKCVLPVYSNWDLLDSCPSGPSQTLNRGKSPPTGRIQRALGFQGSFQPRWTVPRWDSDSCPLGYAGGGGQRQERIRTVVHSAWIGPGGMVGRGREAMPSGTGEPPAGMVGRRGSPGRGRLPATLLSRGPSNPAQCTVGGREVQDHGGTDWLADVVGDVVRLQDAAQSYVIMCQT